MPKNAEQWTVYRTEICLWRKTVLEIKIIREKRETCFKVHTIWSVMEEHFRIKGAHGKIKQQSQVNETTATRVPAPCHRMSNRFSSVFNCSSESLLLAATHLILFRFSKKWFINFKAYDNRKQHIKRKRLLLVQATSRLTRHWEFGKPRSNHRTGRLMFMQREMVLRLNANSSGNYAINMWTFPWRTNKTPTVVKIIGTFEQSRIQC